MNFSIEDKIEILISQGYSVEIIDYEFNSPSYHNSFESDSRKRAIVKWKGSDIHFSWHSYLFGTYDQLEDVFSKLIRRKFKSFLMS